MRDYAGFAAWSYREHLMSRHPRGHRRDPRPGQSRRRACTWDERSPTRRTSVTTSPGTPTASATVPAAVPFPSASSASRSAATRSAIATQPRAGGRTAGSVIRRRDRWSVPPRRRTPRGDAAWLRTVLAEAARRTPRPAWGYDLIVARREGVERILATRSMPTARGDTIVYAVEYSAGTVDSALHEILMTTDLLPPTLTAAGRADAACSTCASRTKRGTCSSRRATGSRGSTMRRPPSRRASAGCACARRWCRTWRRDCSSAARPSRACRCSSDSCSSPLGLTVLAAVMLRREVRFAAERADFVASVSHELRTPLTQVRLVLDTLRLGRGGDAAVARCGARHRRPGGAAAPAPGGGCAPLHARAAARRRAARPRPMCWRRRAPWRANSSRSPRPATSRSRCKGTGR